MRLFLLSSKLIRDSNSSRSSTDRTVPLLPPSLPTSAVRWISLRLYCSPTNSRMVLPPTVCQLSNRAFSVFESLSLLFVAKILKSTDKSTQKKGCLPNAHYNILLTTPLSSSYFSLATSTTSPILIFGYLSLSAKFLCISTPRPVTTDFENINSFPLSHFLLIYSIAGTDIQIDYASTLITLRKLSSQRKD